MTEQDKYIKSLKRSLINAGAKIQHLQREKQTLEEEIEVLKAEIKSNEPMYNEDVVTYTLPSIHEQKQIAFKLGVEKGKRVFNFEHCLMAWFIGAVCGLIIRHLISIGVI